MELVVKRVSISHLKEREYQQANAQNTKE